MTNLAMNLEMKTMYQLCRTPFVLLKSLLQKSTGLKAAALMSCAITSFLPHEAAGQGAGTTDLYQRIKNVESMVVQREYVAARPELRSLLPLADANVRPQLDFYIALSYIYEFYAKDQESLLATAVEEFNAFLQNHPGHHLSVLARYNLGDIYATQGNYKQALKQYIPLYQKPKEHINRKEVLRKIVLVYATEEAWAAGAPYFEDSMRFAVTDIERTTAAAYLMIAKAQMGDFSNSREILGFFSSPAPILFSPRFNFAMIEVGDNLRSSGDLATASLFYQLVRSYESLQGGLENYINQLEAKLASLVGTQMVSQQYFETKAELENMLSQLNALQSSPNYTPLLGWRIAGVYMDIERDWEAYWRLRKLVVDYPEDPNAEAILYSAFSLGYKLEEFDSFAELGEDYLENKDYLNYRSAVADQLSSYYVISEQFEKLFALSKWYLESIGEDSAAISLLFKHGMVRLQRFENRELRSEFAAFKEKYKAGPCELVLDYFLGISNLLEQNHAPALEFFEAVLAKPESQFTADAHFRKAQAVLGLDRISEARELLVAFISNYPENSLRANAELTLGNVLELQGQPNAALEHFYLVEEFTESPALRGEAELKIAAVLERYFRQLDEAIVRLSDFQARYYELPESIPVIVALANLYDSKQEPRKALTLLQNAVERFHAEIAYDAVDTMMQAYLKKDATLRTSQIRSKAFLLEVSTSAELLESLIADRSAQYRYFKENAEIDSVIQDSFIRDNVFRNAILAGLEALKPPAPLPDLETGETPPAEPLILAGEEFPELLNLTVRLERLNSTLPQISASAWIAAKQAEAAKDNHLALELRLQTALALVATPVEKPDRARVALVDDVEQWPYFAVASKIWILSEKAETQPSQVIEILERSRMDFIDTGMELDFFKLLAGLYERTDDQNAAIQVLKDLIQRFPENREAGIAALHAGQLELKNQEYEIARKTFESILFRPEWVGAMHAEALLWIGRAYENEMLYAEAHGFFERIMLGYPGFPELMATAYYEDLKVLQKMGEAASVQTVLEAFKATPGLEATDAANLIRKEFQ